MVCRLNLPDYLEEMIITRYFSIERMGIGLSGVVQMAIGTVELSFQRFNNRLVVRTPTPLPDDGLSVTLSTILEEQFNVMGLRQYLQIIADPPQS